MLVRATIRFLVVLLPSVLAIAYAQTEGVRPRTLDRGAAICPFPRHPQNVPLGVRGVTKLEFVVSSEGVVSDVKILGRSGDTADHVRLDEAAVRYALSCKFVATPGFGPATAVQELAWQGVPPP
jgi:TonB family protein